MSQHKKQAICKTCGATLPNHVPSILDPQGIGDPGHSVKASNTSIGITKPNPFTITDPTELKQLLKAIYRSGATGSPRSMSKDVQTITDLLSKEQA